MQSGDRLTRREFERRYEAMPGVKRAELIEGVVFMSSLSFEASHGQPHAHMVVWLGIYKAVTPGLRIADNTSLRLDNDNEYQPDQQGITSPDHAAFVARLSTPNDPITQ